MMPPMIHFVKGHGLGNDYIVINGADLPSALKPGQVMRICDRNWGVGSDGILLLVPAWAGADFGLRILNPDGSEAEKSGNGLRIFAKYLWDHGLARGRTTFRVDTKGGVVECTCHVRDGRMSFVTVEMGRASFRSAAIPMTGPDRDAVAVPLELPDGSKVTATVVSVGNPHCVVFDQPVTFARCIELGPHIETHPAFPERTNVQLFEVVDRSHVRIEIWERGAGYTLASGTSASAVAAACIRAGLVDDQVTVQMPGGDLEVQRMASGNLVQSGPARRVYRASVEVDDFS